MQAAPHKASTLQLNELADVIKNVPTGGLAPEFRAKVAAPPGGQWVKPETIKAYTGMESGSDAQVLQTGCRDNRRFDDPTSAPMSG